MPRFFFAVCALAVLSVLSLIPSETVSAAPPNVVLVVTDDQGYGDLECLGNPILKTPNLNALHADSVRLTDYHVAPTCSPTRCALLTGHWTNRTGVWHTIMGRSMLRENEVTIGKMFSDAGYATGMFGKWHLGDNYPYRPEDRGFQTVLRHGGGGVGQTPDYWNNAYFDGSYWFNGKPTAVKGFCTDVFFDYARDFIRDSKNSGKPFFAYVATNAPHGPMHAPQHLGDQYLKALQDSGRKPNVSLAHFYGMIANIDDNVGRMRRFLEEEGLTNNTIFIFSTDNGTSSGGGVFNAGMRGRKGSEYDGGHRVPFFVHWPQGGLTGGRDISKITAHVDVVPTLLDLCSLDAPTNVKFDGRSIRPLLEDKGDLTQWPDRILVTDSQRVKDPIKWRKSAVMTDQWRLINGKELFDIDKDPGQQKNVADANPAVVKRLTDFYEAWWAELLPTFANETPIYLGHPAENPARLTAHDWITTGSTPWHQGMIRAGMNGKRTRGFWNVNVHQAGEYEITLRRWPRSVDAKLGDALPAGDDVPGVTALRARPGVAIDIVSASVRIGDQESTIAVKPTDSQAVLRLMLPEGRAQMFATFQTSDGTEYGGYYAYVQRK